MNIVLRLELQSGTFVSGHVYERPASYASPCRAEGDGASSSGGQGLSALFEPPRDLIYPGTADDAKAAAESQGRWLVRGRTESYIFWLGVPTLD